MRPFIASPTSTSRTEAPPSTFSAPFIEQRRSGEVDKGSGSGERYNGRRMGPSDTGSRVQEGRTSPTRLAINRSHIQSSCDDYPYRFMPFDSSSSPCRSLAPTSSSQRPPIFSHHESNRPLASAVPSSQETTSPPLPFSPSGVISVWRISNPSLYTSESHSDSVTPLVTPRHIAPHPGTHPTNVSSSILGQGHRADIPQLPSTSALELADWPDTEREDGIMDVDGEDGEGRPRSGREERRKEQNRAAQRVFRAKAKIQTQKVSDHIKNLENTTRLKQAKIDEQSVTISALRAENNLLWRVGSTLLRSAQPHPTSGSLESDNGTEDKRNLFGKNSLWGRERYDDESDQ